MSEQQEILHLWLQATDRAIAALRDWRRTLAGELVSRTELEAALLRLSEQGLSEWAEWGSELDLDALADALSRDH